MLIGFGVGVEVGGCLTDLYDGGISFFSVGVGGRGLYTSKYCWCRFSYGYLA